MNTGELLKNQLEGLYEELESKVIQRDELINEIKAIDFEIAQVKDLLNYYHGKGIIQGVNLALEPITLENPADEKKNYVKWRHKVIECLANNNRLMTTGEILEYAIPEVTKDLRRKYIANLSSALVGMYNGGIIQKYEGYEGRGHLYGLPSMFDSNNMPLDQYKPFNRSNTT